MSKDTTEVLAQPFSGLRVVDLSDRLPGAFASRLFGDLGAEVIQVRSPIDHAERRSPHDLSDAYANWNKSLELLAPDDPARLDLIASADLVVTTDGSTPAGVSGVQLSITPHGLTGPLAGVAGNQLTTNARSGWAACNALADEPPLQLPGNVVSHIAGVAGFIAAGAALLQETGFRTIDVSELEAIVQTCTPWATGSMFKGEYGPEGPLGRRPRGRKGPLFKTSDGTIAVSFGDWKNWTAAMALFGLDDIGADPNLIPDFGRHQQDLLSVANAAAGSISELERWPLFHRLGELRCTSGCMLSMEDLLTDAQLNERGFIVKTEVDGKTVRTAGPPWRSEPKVWHLCRPAPTEHSEPPPTHRRSKPERSETKRSEHDRSAGPINPELPLEGVRVLSFNQAWSGTFGTELLAFLGADVVQLELLHKSDVFRNTVGRVLPMVEDASRRQIPPNVSGLYNSVNLNKRAIALNMNDESGREIFWRLVPRFDIVTENFAPHVLPRWGITIDTLAQARPAAILASISGYGLGGPYTSYPAIGTTIEPMSGLSSLLGYVGDKGMNTGGLIPDPIAGYFLAASVIAALHRRRHSPEPQRIDLAMMEAVAATIGDAMAQVDGTGQTPGPSGNRHPDVAPHGIYPTADGRWIALAAETNDAWSRLVESLQLGDDPTIARFATASDRKANEEELDELISVATVTRECVGLADELSSKGIAAAPVAHLTDIYLNRDQHLMQRGFLQEVEHPESGTNLLPGPPWQFAAGVQPALRPAPCVGQHSREVLTAELGLSSAEYDQLVSDGVTGTL
ncbi:MAG: CoA transferase [Acidimicrobiales bacterium]